MKNTNYIINGVLAVAVIILFILFFTGKKNVDTKETLIATDSVGVKLPIAYFNSDTLMTNYSFAKDLNEKMLKKIESSRAVINQKQQQFQKDYLTFESNRQNNAFLSTERRVQEQERLARKQQELEELVARTQDEFMAEQAKMNRQLSDTIVASLKIFNNPAKYQIIFNNRENSPIVIADNAYDITNEVLKFLNSRYVPTKE